MAKIVNVYIVRIMQRSIAHLHDVAWLIKRFDKLEEAESIYRKLKELGIPVSLERETTTIIVKKLA